MTAPRGRDMATLEERVAYLEGQTSEQSSTTPEIRLDIRDLRTEMSRRFDQVDVKFTWMIGFQFATLMAVIAALLNVYFR